MSQPQPTAALAGIPSGLQGQGPWLGRRQVFVRFAGEAETATMYTAQALVNELRRATTRSAYHSIAVGGRDALGNGEFLASALGAFGGGLPVLLATDGQRPESLGEVEKHVTLVQVALDPAAPDAVAERALETLRVAARAGREHALVIAAGDATDGQVLRVVERAHATSGGTIIVVHPDSASAANAPASGEAEPVRGVAPRWTALMDRLVGLHADTRLLLRIPAPVGMT